MLGLTPTTGPIAIAASEVGPTKGPRGSKNVRSIGAEPPPEGAGQEHMQTKNPCKQSMYVCIHLGMYVCMHVCMYACTHVCMYAGLRIATDL